VRDGTAARDAERVGMGKVRWEKREAVKPGSSQRQTSHSLCRRCGRRGDGEKPVHGKTNLLRIASMSGPEGRCKGGQGRKEGAVRFEVGATKVSGTASLNKKGGDKSHLEGREQSYHGKGEPAETVWKEQSA